jgi:choline-glycine betaine transporter
LTASWGWIYLVSVNVFVLITLAIACSPLGAIRLGQDHERPDISRLS